MFHLLKVFLDICLLRAPPQTIPKSTLLQALTLLTYVVANGFLAAEELPGWKAVLAAGVDALLLVALAQTVLWVRNTPERVTQTVTALAGTGTLLTLIAMPVLAALQHGDQANVIQALAWIALVFWSIIVVGHIIRHAMSVHFLWGMAISAGYWYISYNVMYILFLQNNA